MVIRKHHAAAVLAGLLTVTGCGAVAGGCTDMGAVSGITFEFASVLTKAGARGANVEACVASECTARTLRNQTDFQVLVDDGISDETPVLVTLIVTAKTGQVLFDGETEVVPQKTQPNGPGCEPTVYTAQVSATDVDNLSVQDQ